MSVRYCQRHLIGFEDNLDPVCPQCALSGGAPAADHESKEAATAARDAERLQRASKQGKP